MPKPCNNKSLGTLHAYKTEPICVCMHVCVHLCMSQRQGGSPGFSRHMQQKYGNGKLSSCKEAATLGTYSKDYQIIPLLLLLIHIRRLLKCTVNVEKIV